MSEDTLSKFKLVVVKGEHDGMEFDLPEGEIIIGRWDPETASFPDINLENLDVEAKVSHKHAKITVNAGHVTVEDLGSLNGTYVNRGEQLSPNIKCNLQLNDEIIFGKTVTRLEKQDT